MIRRNGRYAEYHGEEYYVGGGSGKGMYNLMSDNPESQKDGFIPYVFLGTSETGLYIKRVKGSELTRIYDLETTIEFKGIPFDLLGVGKETISISYCRGVDHWKYRKIGMPFSRAVEHYSVKLKDIGIGKPYIAVKKITERNPEDYD